MNTSARFVCALVFVTVLAAFGCWFFIGWLWLLIVTHAAWWCVPLWFFSIAIPGCAVFAWQERGKS